MKKNIGIFFTDSIKGQKQYDCLSYWTAIKKVFLNGREIKFGVVKVRKPLGEYFIRLKYPPRKRGLLRIVVEMSLASQKPK